MFSNLSNFCKKKQITKHTCIISVDCKVTSTIAIIMKTARVKSFGERFKPSETGNRIKMVLREYSTGYQNIKIKQKLNITGFSNKFMHIFACYFSKRIDIFRHMLGYRELLFFQRSH